MMDLTSSAQRLGRTLAQTQVFDLSCFLELGHRLDGGFDGLLRVDAVAVVEVDGIDAEALEGFVACFVDVGGFVTHGARAVRVGIICEFGGEEDLVAFASLLKPSAEQLESVKGRFVITNVICRAQGGLLDVRMA